MQQAFFAQPFAQGHTGLPVMESDEPASAQPTLVETSALNPWRRTATIRVLPFSRLDDVERFTLNDIGNERRRVGSI